MGFGTGRPAPEERLSVVTVSDADVEVDDDDEDEVEFDVEIAEAVVKGDVAVCDDAVFDEPETLAPRELAVVAAVEEVVELEVAERDRARLALELEVG